MFFYYFIFMGIDMLLAIPMWKTSSVCGYTTPYWTFCIPIYNLLILCDIAKISRLTLFGALTLAVILPFTPLASTFCSWLISYLFFAYLSGTLAIRFSANKYLWGLLGGFLFIAPVIYFGFIKRLDLPETD